MAGEGQGPQNAILPRTPPNLMHKILGRQTRPWFLISPVIFFTREYYQKQGPQGPDVLAPMGRRLAT